MTMPGPVDYADELQNPQLCFRDPELKQFEVKTTPLGIPHLITGNFAAVCQLYKRQKKWAVRCFLKEVHDQQQHYRIVSDYLDKLQFLEFVAFKYIFQGIRIRNQWHPIVKMEWVEGERLNVFVERQLRKPKALPNFAEQFRKLVDKMRRHGMAHGDLQHGNILVAPDGQIRLVDYDGMYVSTTGRIKCPELGHYNYQHPRRSGTDYDTNLDNFSAIVIYLSLLALAQEPKFWAEYHNGENLILTKEDYKKPLQSHLLRRLEHSADRRVKHLAQCLEASCQDTVPQVPDLETVLAQIAPVAPPPPKKVDPYWWKDQQTVPTSSALKAWWRGQRLPIERPSPKGVSQSQRVASPTNTIADSIWWTQSEVVESSFTAPLSSSGKKKRVTKIVTLTLVILSILSIILFFIRFSSWRWP